MFFLRHSVCTSIYSFIAHSWQTATEHTENETNKNNKNTRIKRIKNLIALFVQHASYKITAR